MATLNPAQLLELANLASEIPSLVKRNKKDGEQIKAFFDDIQDLLKKPLKLEEQIQVYTSILYIALTARSIKISFDPFKQTRLKCDEVARILDLKRYKALRGIK